MKNIVLRDDFREYEIRPKSEFLHYLELLSEDVKEIFNGNAGKYFHFCPACASEESTFKFSKLDFIYRECSECGSLYLSPRPTRELLHNFFKNSKGLKFWNSKVMQETESRKKHVFNPRVRWVQQTADINDVATGVYMDYYSKYDYFLEELATKGEFSKQISYKPVQEIEPALTNAGFELRQELPEAGSCSLITVFEVIDRLYHPRSVLEDISKTLSKDGILMITTLSASGFDIQMLQEHSRSIVPPIHLNLFSVEGIQTLLEHYGFNLLELSSPGSLDFSLVANALQENPDIQVPKFVNDIIYHRNDYIKQAFQEFLQRGVLSSHLRIVAQKK